jgi:hypothetical protein
MEMKAVTSRLLYTMNAKTCYIFIALFANVFSHNKNKECINVFFVQMTSRVL